MDFVSFIRDKCIKHMGLDALYQMPGVSQVECEVIDQRRWVQIVRAIYKIQFFSDVHYVAIEFTEPLTEIQEGSGNKPEEWNYYEVVPQEVKVIKYVAK